MTKEKDHGASLAEGQPLASPSLSDAATARHTEGPWEVQTHLGNANILRVMPVMKRTNMGQLPVWEGGGFYFKNAADAHLIAAAPELLEVLKACEPLWDRGLSDAIKTFVLHHHEQVTFDELGARVKAAIRKAEGRVW